MISDENPSKFKEFLIEYVGFTDDERKLNRTHLDYARHAIACRLCSTYSSSDEKAAWIESVGRNLKLLCSWMEDKNNMSSAEDVVAWALGAAALNSNVLVGLLNMTRLVRF